MLRCPLCGYQFDESQVTCHSGCPMKKGCRMTTCPHCSYEFPLENSTVVRWIRRLFSSQSSSSDIS